MMSMIKMLILFLLYFTALCSTERYNLLPNVLTKQIRNLTIDGSNALEYNLWLKYLDKRLQIMCMTVKQKGVHYLLEFYTNNFNAKLFRNIDTICTRNRNSKRNEGVQDDIFGRICGSSKHGKTVPDVDLCQYIKGSIGRDRCNWFRDQYRISHFNLMGLRLLLRLRNTWLRMIYCLQTIW